MKAVEGMTEPSDICSCFVAIATGAAFAAAAQKSTPAEVGRPPLATKGQAHGSTRVVLAALTKAQSIGLSGEKSTEIWQNAFAVFFHLFIAHLHAVAAARKKLTDPAEVVELFTLSVPVELLNAVFAVTQNENEKQDKLKAAVTGLNG